MFGQVYSFQQEQISGYCSEVQSLKAGLLPGVRVVNVVVFMLYFSFRKAEIREGFVAMLNPSVVRLKKLIFLVLFSYLLQIFFFHRCHLDKIMFCFV